MIVAAIYADSGDKYIPNVEFFFMGLAIGGTIVGIYMNYYDYTHGNVFNKVHQLEDDEFDADAPLGPPVPTTPSLFKRFTTFIGLGPKVEKEYPKGKRLIYFLPMCLYEEYVSTLRSFDINMLVMI